MCPAFSPYPESSKECFNTRVLGASRVDNRRTFGGQGRQADGASRLPLLESEPVRVPPTVVTDWWQTGVIVGDRKLTFDGGQNKMIG